RGLILKEVPTSSKIAMLSEHTNERSSLVFALALAIAHFAVASAAPAIPSYGLIAKVGELELDLAALILDLIPEI
ncbi:hypothetical protein BGX26_011575, partial [Mortierella sp. AD094]